MKKIFKVLISLFVILGIFIIPKEIFAASSSMSASQTTVYVGDSITVSVYVQGSAMYTVQGTFSSDSGALSGSGSIWRKADLNSEPDGFSSASASSTFVAQSEGTATITFTPSGNNCIDVDGNSLDLNESSISINVVNDSSGGGSNGGNDGGNNNGGSQTPTPTANDTEDNKASDNTLSSLVVSKGTLDPVFDSATEVYKLVLSADATAITIEATANDAKATVSGTGEQSVKPGDNKLEVLVTAENGDEKTYVINAYVDEKPDTFMSVKGKDYGVITNVDSVVVPKGFEKTTLTYNGKEIPAWKNNLSNLTLVYLINEKSEKNFYIIENNEITSVYIPLALLGNEVAIIDVPEDIQKRKGMEFTEVEVDGHKMSGWKFNDEQFSTYSLVYLMNDKGEKVFYQYEKVSNTLQPYSGAAAITQEEYESLSSMNLYLMIGAGIFGVLAILFLILWRKNAHHKTHGKGPETIEETEEKNEVEEETIQQPTQAKTQPSRPTYHRQRAVKPTETEHSEAPKPVKKEEDLGTQPFRFHDDFDDQKLK